MNNGRLIVGGIILLAILVIGYYLYDTRGNYRYFGDEYSFESLPETLYNVKYYADDRGMIWVHIIMEHTHSMQGPHLLNGLILNIPMIGKWLCRIRMKYRRSRNETTRSLEVSA